VPCTIGELLDAALAFSTRTAGMLNRAAHISSARERTGSIEANRKQQRPGQRMPIESNRIEANSIKEGSGIGGGGDKDSRQKTQRLASAGREGACPKPEHDARRAPFEHYSWTFLRQ
jgi:hypothetical protein